MGRMAAVPLLAAALLKSLPVPCTGMTKPAILPEGGCATPAAVTAVAGSGLKTDGGMRVIDNNLRTKWVAKGKGQSLWLELAMPTVIDAVAIAFRKGNKRSHKFRIYLVTKDNQAEIVYEGESSGDTKEFQIFSLGAKAKEAEAVTIVGFGNSKNKWNGYAEVELCTSESPVEEAPEVEIEGTETTTESEAEAETGTESEAEAETGTESEAESTVEFTELPFPTGRKGFNVVNLCSFPVRVGSTGNAAPCVEGTKENPANGNCFWALPEGKRDLRPGEAGHYVLPDVASVLGSVIWAGNIFVSTGCASEISEDYDFPATPECVTNYCPGDGVCPDYRGPSGATTKAEFGMVEAGLDFYDVSIIDGSNIPMEIVPIDPVFNADDHYCGIPGSPTGFGDMDACQWKFSPENVTLHEDQDLSPYTRVVWPADSSSLVACRVDSDCESSDAGKDGGDYGFCGIYEERDSRGQKTGSLVPGTCGRTVAWIGGHTACGAKTKEGEIFPAEFPYYCTHAASADTVKRLIRCEGPVYSKQACYLPNAKETCCGCPFWDVKNGGCVSSNPEWTKNALPWASFFKSACPTAYSFPRDDRTAVFVCTNGEMGTTEKNTQSYSIRLCPGDSEKSFYT